VNGVSGQVAGHQVPQAAGLVQASGAPERRRPPLMRPLTPVAPGTRVLLGIAFFVLFVAVWSAATFSGWVNPLFLADPLKMLRSGWTLLTEMGFAYDIGMTVWRVLGGFAIAAALAVPLGVMMGAYKPIEAFFEPFVSFARYLPASAFIPLLILWAGIGEAQKLAVIFIGAFFSLVLMISVTVGNTRRDLVEAAYTLGVSDRGLIRRVLIPGAAPEIAEQLRMVLGWAWTYVIVAELIGASSGIGHMITDSQALLATDQIIFGIIVIGVIGLVSDLGFKWANRAAFPWAALGK
jgi:NitT/TauT family transport system permease protein